jgi:hypothetical protein
VKLLKGLAFGVIVEVAFVGVFVGAELVQGTRWVFPFLAMVGLPVLAITFPEKTRVRRRKP